MIVCHCNRIDHREIEEACQHLEARDGLRLVTPVAVYKHLGKRPRCGGCMMLAANLIQDRGTGSSCGVTGVCPILNTHVSSGDLIEEETSVFLGAAE